MVFGEVDCRIHIYNRYVMSGGKLDIEDVIVATVDNYGAVLKEIEGKGIDLYVASVPPGGREGNVFGVPNYPPPDMRCVINRTFNESLESFCRLNGIKFIDVYSLVVDEHGFIKPEYSYEDGTHLNTTAVRFFEEGLGSLGG
jgi:lysophospholipase L1-like esterase